MKIRQILWPEDRIEHIAKHNIQPFEIEEACFDKPLIYRGKKKGKNSVYYILGQTNSGRYLFCVMIQFPDENGYPITARPMTDRERRRFNQWKNK